MNFIDPIYKLSYFYIAVQCSFFKVFFFSSFYNNMILMKKGVFMSEARIKKYPRIYNNSLSEINLLKCLQSSRDIRRKTFFRRLFQ